MKINNDPIHRRMDGPPGRQKLIKVEMVSIKNRLAPLFIFLNSDFNEACIKQMMILYQRC